MLGHDDKVWATVCEALEGNDIGGPILRTNEGVAIAFSTAHGDGVYTVKKVYSEFGEVPVDAGLIGLVPVALVTKEPDAGLVLKVSFPRDFECTTDGKTLCFGRYEIETDE